MRHLAALAMVIAVLSISGAQADTVTVCTAVEDAATGKSIRQEGSCDTSVTPASTFKIAISLMGYDSGFLKGEHTPKLPFREGYPDWIESWKAETDPAAWMKNSVVWYSQQITQSLGEDRFRGYVREFHYGNEDVSGDPDRRNGLTRAWLASSLRVSPLGQLEFLRKVVRRELPVSPYAYEMTSRLIDIGVQPGGWHVYGKTGSGFPREPDGTFDRARGCGWFVGWAKKEGRTVVFARLIQDSKRQQAPAGPRARDAVVRDLFSTPEAL